MTTSSLIPLGIVLILFLLLACSQAISPPASVPTTLATSTVVPATPTSTAVPTATPRPPATPTSIPTSTATPTPNEKFCKKAATEIELLFAGEHPTAQQTFTKSRRAKVSLRAIRPAPAPNTCFAIADVYTLNIIDEVVKVEARRVIFSRSWLRDYRGTDEVWDGHK